MRIVAAVIVGCLMAIAGAHMLFLGWWTLVPWGIAGVVLGGFSRKGETAVCGALYGFVLVFVFLVSGYTGAPSLLSRVPFFSLFGLFGALCGLLLTLIGSFLKKRISVATRKPKSAA
jgi:hypothetical protein